MKIDNKFFRAILWYTLTTSSGVILIDVINLFRVVTTWNLTNVLFFFISLLVESICVVQTIRIIKNIPSKRSYIFIMVYWISQTIILGFKGNTYCFTTGPSLMIYFKYVGNVEWDYLLKFWSQEISFNINTVSDKIYIAFNIIPIMVSAALIYFKKTFIYSNPSSA